MTTETTEKETTGAKVGLSSAKRAFERFVRRLVEDKTRTSKICAWVWTLIAFMHAIGAVATHNWLAAYFAAMTAWFAWATYWAYADA